MIYQVDIKNILSVNRNKIISDQILGLKWESDMYMKLNGLVAIRKLPVAITGENLIPVSLI